MKIATILSAFSASNIPFAYAVDFKFYLTTYNCNALGEQCGNLPPNRFCAVQGSRGYAAFSFIDFSGHGPINGRTYITSQDDNLCGTTLYSNLQLNVCYAETDSAPGPVTCGLYLNSGSADSQDHEDPKFIEPDSIFYQEGATTYHINKTNVDKVDGFWSVIEKGGQEAGVEYVLQHFDRVEQSSVLSKPGQPNVA